MRKIGRIFFTIICICFLVCSAADMIPRAYAASSMAASESCVEFIKSVEGFSAKPYFDYAQYTVGYGTKCPDEKYATYMASGIPKSEAEALLREEIGRIENDLNQKLLDKYNLTVTQHQFDALVSFSYNIGTGWVTYDSSLRNAILRNADANELVYAFGLYCTADGKYLPGLITRRLCEANMYLNGVYSKTVTDAYGYVYYDATGGTVKYRVQAYICDSNTAPAADALRSADTFLGWYTELYGGTQVTTLDRTMTGKTLFARWQSSENTENTGNPENTDNPNATSTTVKVTGDVVNIRSGPGTNYGITSRAYRNDTLTVSHVTHLTNMKWGKVPSGWICLDYTNYDAVMNGTGNTDIENNNTPSVDVTVPDPAPEWNAPDVNVSPDNQTAVSGIVKVNDFLNIRSGPGIAYANVGFLFRDTKVSILEQRTVGASVWGRIEKGWVCMDYIVTDTGSTGGTTVPTPVPNPVPNPAPEQTTKPDQAAPDASGRAESTSITGTITADALRVRSGAGTTNAIVGFYYQNERVTVTEKVLVGSVYWGKTSKGWISMDYVLADTSGNVTDQPSGGETTQPSGSEMKTVIGDCLRIRLEAGTVYKIVGFLYYGDNVAVLETKDVNGTVWGRVNNGWICMDYVR